MIAAKQIIQLTDLGCATFFLLSFARGFSGDRPVILLSFSILMSYLAAGSEPSFAAFGVIPAPSSNPVSLLSVCVKLLLVFTFDFEEVRTSPLSLEA